MTATIPSPRRRACRHSQTELLPRRGRYLVRCASCGREFAACDRMGEAFEAFRLVRETTEEEQVTA